MKKTTDPKVLIGWNKEMKKELRKLLALAKKNKTTYIHFRGWTFYFRDVDFFLNEYNPKPVPIKCKGGWNHPIVKK